MLIDGIEIPISDRENATKYDDWAFYRNQFQKVGAGQKGVDIITIDNDKVLRLIELKDYRRNERTKNIEISLEIADKVRDTIAGIFTASINANDNYEKEFSKKCLQSNKIKVILYLLQPKVNSKLFPIKINIVNLTKDLKRKIKAIDPRPKVIGNIV